MGPLLPQAVENAALAAIKLVTDTFMITPVVYEMWQDAIPSEWNNQRDREANRYRVLNLQALYEQPDNNDSEAKFDVNGTIVRADVKLTFNMQDLASAGLVDPVTKAPVFTISDRFTVKGSLYYAKKIAGDGPLNPQDVLLVIYGMKDDKRA